VDTFYSLTLLAGVITGGLAAGMVLVDRIAPNRIATSTRTGWGHYGRICAIAAGIIGLFSAISHLTFSHGSKSPESMGMIDFAASHVSFGIVLALVLLSKIGRRLPA